MRLSALIAVCFVPASAYTSTLGAKRVSALASGQDFDASTCKSLSGTTDDDEWCVASCGAPIKPDCPSSFCKCEGEVPFDSSHTDASADRDAEIAKRDAATAEHDGDLTEAAGKRDAEIAQRDADIAGSTTGPTNGSAFDASTCKSLSGTTKDDKWCVASCGAPIKPDCPSSFCECEGEVPFDSTRTDASADRDAEIAKRDEAVSGRKPEAAGTATASADKESEFDASTCVSLSGTKKDDVWCVASCGAPIKPDCPSSVCKCEGEVPFDSSRTDAGADRDAEIAKRDEAISGRKPEGAGTEAAGPNTAGESEFDASTCVSLAGTKKEDEWCVASCGAPIKPDCPSSVCKCKGEVPFDSSRTDAGADRDAEIAKRDEAISGRAPGAADSANVSASFDAQSCVSLSKEDTLQPGKKEDDDKWCLAHCALEPPDCPETFCTCDGEMPQGSGLTPAQQDAKKKVEERDAATAERDAQVADRSGATADRDAEIAKRDEAISHRKPEGEGGGQADCPKGRVCPDGIL